LGATELIRHCLPDGRVLFVELAVGLDKLLLNEVRSPTACHPGRSMLPGRAEKIGAAASKYRLGAVQ
jgi:hypothetical protein